MSKIKLSFKESYSKLPSEFFTKVQPEGFALNPNIISSSKESGSLIGLTDDDFQNPDFANYFSGNKLLEGSDPIAKVYSGHQFGVWAGQLGDGRALLLGQVLNSEDELWDVELKGAGKTPYSRFGDGRAVLRSCIREFLCSEHMHALGIPTSRALSIIGTNETVTREKKEPGAILTRLAKSHIRFGHFEHFHYRKEYENVKILADYCIENYHTDIKKEDYNSWFFEIVKSTAELIAKWQAIGFCHGVLNTDNMSIIGITLDYGPFGFLDNFDPYYICNHSDHSGRYSYDQQPGIGLWNLNALLNALSSIIDIQEARNVLAQYESIFVESYYKEMYKKLALDETDLSEDKMKEHIDSFLSILIENNLDYTSSLRALSYTQTNSEELLIKLGSTEASHIWIENYKLYTKDIPNLENIINTRNPKYILRNWVAESIIRAVEDNKNLTFMEELQKVLVAPFDEHSQFTEYSELAPDKYKDISVSCSS